MKTKRNFKFALFNISLMKKTLLSIAFLILLIGGANGQSKKDLREEVDRLNTEIAQKDEALREAQKKVNISESNAAEYEAQVSELKAANATLLNNLKTFTESSSQRLETLSQTLESLRQKEAQFKVINDEFSKNDSIALLVLTGFKQTLGENAQIGVQTGAVVVQLNSTTLFGGPTSSQLSADGDAFLSKIAAVIKANPDTEATLVTQFDSINRSPATDQRSLAIINSIRTNTQGQDHRLYQTSKGSAGESFQIRIHPKLNSFYLRVRESVKNRG